MPALASDLRSQLEKAIIRARATAEDAARAALATLAVNHDEPHAGMSDDQRQLRRALRARARQLGDGQLKAGHTPLIEEVAYEQWHRMLFARFLAENHLLMHPSGVPVTLADCAELAAEEDETDLWLLAARYASAMLPGIFRLEDPSAQVRFAPESRVALERLLDDLPAATFTADDALGWVYQFWQTKRKDEVNRSERKIGAEELPAVTQLFTEDYMVRFLLENSLGAWWAGRHPDSPLIKDYAYLRYRDDGTPAAGTFPGWPACAAEVTVMDPCCGSGHFLVAAFEMLRRMRMEEESLGEVEAGVAVIRDNLFGLEIDPRCTQIAAFALVLAAWKAGGYRTLPLPNIACSGIPVAGQLEEWQKLAGDDVAMRWTMERLYTLFRDAPTLGSLINPTDVPLKDRMFAPDYAQVAPLLEKAISQSRAAGDPVAAVFGNAVEGVARAAELLAKRYALVATNVPYLGLKRQGAILKQHVETRYPESKADLATVFVERSLAFTQTSGIHALVTPHNWLFQVSSTAMRTRLLREQSWNLIARLGAGAFEMISGEVVKVALTIITNQYPDNSHILTSIDATIAKDVRRKNELLKVGALNIVPQSAVLRNPDARVALAQIDTTSLLRDVASSSAGMLTGDRYRFYRYFWEIPAIDANWEFSQTSVTDTKCVVPQMR